MDDPAGGAGALAGLRVVVFESRRGEEIERMLSRHGARVLRAPALREEALLESPEALDLARRLRAGEVAALILLTGVGTRAHASAVRAVAPDFAQLLARTTVIARGPKPIAALRELGFADAQPVPSPHTWRQVLAAVDQLGLSPGALVAVQEYGAPATPLTDALAERGFAVLRVPVYRWALPTDTAPLRRAADEIGRGAADVTVFTSAVQVEHLFRIAPDAAALRAGLARTVVASVGPVCSEGLEAHGVAADVEADPPKMGPLVALVAERARGLLAGKRN